MLWNELLRDLKLGGTFEKDDDGIYFCIPYVHSNKKLNKLNYDFEWYQTAVCISSLSKVFHEPNINSEVLGKLKYDIVEIDINSNSDGYYKT